MGNFSGCAPIRVFSLVCEDQPYEKPKDVAAVRKPFQSAPGVPPELAKQPPAAPAATEAASLHLARRAPHPSADTSPGTEPSPRMPAMLTVPPRQKLVDEATSVKAVTLAADPSSLPVADLVVRRAASSWRKNLAFWPGFHLNRGEYTEGEGQGKPGPKHAVPPWGRCLARPLSGYCCKEGRASLNWLMEEDICHAVSRSLGIDSNVGGHSVVGHLLCPQSE
jgi:hypothetical protein